VLLKAANLAANKLYICILRVSCFQQLVPTYHAITGSITPMLLMFPAFFASSTTRQQAFLLAKCSALNMVYNVIFLLIYFISRVALFLCYGETRKLFH